MAVTTLGSFTQSEIEYFRELSLLKGELDYQSHMAHAKETGLEEGLKEGLEKGLKEGRKEGRKEGLKIGLEEGRNEGLKAGLKEGLEKGRNEANLDIARNLKKMGLSVSQIAEGTGLSEEIIGQL